MLIAVFCIVPTGASESTCAMANMHTHLPELRDAVSLAEICACGAPEETPPSSISPEPGFDAAACGVLPPATSSPAAPVRHQHTVTLPACHLHAHDSKRSPLSCLEEVESSPVVSALKACTVVAGLLDKKEAAASVSMLLGAPAWEEVL